jgi:hypothetical protein
MEGYLVGPAIRMAKYINNTPDTIPLINIKYRSIKVISNTEWIEGMGLVHVGV